MDFHDGTKWTMIGFFYGVHRQPLEVKAGHDESWIYRGSINCGVY